MAVFNRVSRLSFHTMKKNGAVIFVVEHDYSRGMFGEFPEKKVFGDEDVEKLTYVDIPDSVENQECSRWEHSKHGFQRNYYDLTLALGHMGEKWNSIYAEHYIADIGNMLQMFFKYVAIKEINFRLFATYYVSPKSKLMTTTYNYTEADLVIEKNPTLKVGIAMFEKSKDFSLAILKLWKSEYKNFPSSLQNKLHPKIFIKPIFYPSPKWVISSNSGYSTEPLVTSSSPVNQLMDFTSAVLLMYQDRVIDDYLNVMRLGHEIVHLFGVKHDEEYSKCVNNRGMMMYGTNIPKFEWNKVTSCTLDNVLWDKYFDHVSLPEPSYFNFEIEH
ncbi:hypothetical protein HMI54_001381 [Coelomomyces lativittatus]|nr:hypothetical protein HMI54_001381 [Coelomomyces lativittatus]